MFDQNAALSMLTRAASVRQGLGGLGALTSCPSCQRLVQSSRGPVCISDPACHYSNTRTTEQGGDWDRPPDDTSAGASGTYGPGSQPQTYASAANAAANSGRATIPVVIKNADGSTRVVNAGATNDAGQWFGPNQGSALDKFFDVVGSIFQPPAAAQTLLPQPQPFYTQGWFLLLVGAAAMGGVGLAIAKSRK